MLYVDIHTHVADADGVMSPDGLPDGADEYASVVNCNERLSCTQGRYFSAGIHPWWVADGWSDRMSHLEQLVQRPDVVAVGECGLDRLRGGEWSLQLACFEAQVALAEQVGKPLLIHCVKAYDDVIRICRGIRTRCIIHGFRGKPQLAAQLLQHGFDLSFGLRYNPDSLRLAYARRRMWLETDDGCEGGIRAVYSSASSALNISPTDLLLPGTIVP